MYAGGEVDTGAASVIRARGAAKKAVQALDRLRTGEQVAQYRISLVFFSMVRQFL